MIHPVWKGTFVEERSLAHSISVLRKILGDGTERNRYIETVPRHGYRFIAPVELHEKNPPKKRVRDRQRCIRLRCCRSCFTSRIQKYSKRLYFHVSISLCFQCKPFNNGASSRCRCLVRVEDSVSQEGKVLQDTSARGQLLRIEATCPKHRMIRRSISAQ